MLNHTLPSIEEFAAFLDGNLSQSEMHHFSQFAEQDETLHQLLDANSVVDESLGGFTDAELQLPSDLVGVDFELPTIPSEEVSTLVSLSPEPVDDMLVAACSDDDVSMFSEINQDDNTTIGERMHDDSLLTTPDNDGFDNNNDSSDTFSDNI
ncbi:hypothetical protein [uncultured Prevotella sp.]|uniref:hypothetical protein n=1 Tax=uncultured Prevotella sp. TaxID=159272 RepID=UPI002636F64E|nr:hypothetical protein [uncultured Prevotella sp.]